MATLNSTSCNNSFILKPNIEMPIVSVYSDRWLGGMPESFMVRISPNPDQRLSYILHNWLGMGPKIMSNMVQIPLAPLSKWVHILWPSIFPCPEVVKDGNRCQLR